MSQTLNLYRLQQVDNQIDRATNRLNAIQNALDDNNTLLQAREKANNASAVNMSAIQTLQVAETNAQNHRVKIEQTEASLYKGKGHSPKELLELQNDVVSLKQHLIKLEEIQLDAMLAVEISDTLNIVAQTEMQNTQTQLNENNQELFKEKDTLQKELEKLLSERQAIVGPIPLDAITLYDKLRKQKRGFAVAVITENACSACGSALSASQMQSSRASDLMSLCPSCGRILYGN